MTTFEPGPTAGGTGVSGGRAAGFGPEQPTARTPHTTSGRHLRKAVIKGVYERTGFAAASERERVLADYILPHLNAESRPFGNRNDRAVDFQPLHPHRLQELDAVQFRRH